MNISEHITFYEATKTNTGELNEPNEQQLENMELLAENVFEPLRKLIGHPIKINSFFRSKVVNEMVKGAANSHHLCNKGAAIDITTIDENLYTNKELFDTIKENLSFTQLINEYDYSWIHVSYDINNLKNQIINVK